MRPVVFVVDPYALASAAALVGITRIRCIAEMEHPQCLRSPVVQFVEIGQQPAGQACGEPGFDLGIVGLVPGAVERGPIGQLKLQATPAALGERQVAGMEVQQDPVCLAHPLQ